MTNPAEYISGRTVQEQMNQLISYVDTRSAEVAVDAIASDMATLAQAVQDAQDAQAAAEQARDTAVSTVSDCVKKTPAASQTITGQDLIISGADVEAVDGRFSGNLTVGGTAAITGTATVPTQATGTYNTQAANSTKVKNELDAYVPMVRTTGNQTIAGAKTFTTSPTVNVAWGSYKIKNPNIDATNITSETQDAGGVILLDTNDVVLIRLRMNVMSNGRTLLQAQVRNSDGTYKYTTLATGDTI